VKIKDFTELRVWQRAHELTLLVYRLTEKFPRREQFGITSQLRRSSAAVPANIAEGFGRGTTKELLQSLRIARGELSEARYFLILSRDLQFLAGTDFLRAEQLAVEIGQMLNALSRSLQSRLTTSHKSQVTSHRTRGEE